jgi:hypothetical protein
MDETPIVGTITVTDSGPEGVAALFDGTPRHFPDLPALFTAAVRLLDQASAGAPPYSTLESSAA